MYKTTDGGSTWTSAGSYDALDIYFFDAYNGYASSVVGNSMKKTTNGGATWTSITPPNSSSMWGTFATSASTCYFIATDHKIHKSTNSGTSFTTVTTSLSYPTDICFTDPNTGYVTAQSGQILKTSNAGTSWLPNYTGTPGIQLNAVYFVNSNLGFVCGTSGTILKTTNAGASWTPLVSGTTAILSSIRFYDALNGIAVGSGGTILHSLDGGTTWVPDVSNTTKWLYSVSYTGSANSAIVVGDSGAVLKNTSIPAGIISAQNTSGTISCFPNPANQFTVLDITAAENTKAGIELFDLGGALVQTFREVALTEGENKIQLNLAGCSPGVYILRVRTGENSTEKKIVITR